MEVKRGYKKTEVGLIPEDWDACKIGNICHLINGRGFKPHEWQKSGLPIIRIQNLNGSGEFNYYSGQYDPKILVEHGQLLFAWSGSRGSSFGPHIWIGGQALLNYHTWKILINEEAVRPDFLFYALLQLTVKIEEKAHGASALVHTQKGEMEQFHIPVPSTEIEQSAIASALDDMNALLDGLDRMITKKHAIKQATMQQLLTGQTRLPGFKDEWKVKRLGNHLTFLKNGVSSRAELSYSEDVRYLHYGDIHGSSRVVLNPTNVEMPCLPRAKASRLDRLQDGDLIYADASENRDGIGKSVEIQNATGVELVAGLHTIAVRFDKSVLADGFKAYIQFIPEFRSHLRQLAAGTKVYATNRAHIASAELRLPRIDEQKAISALLTDMDTEITALEARRSKTLALRQAMMQELLTGRTRLV